MPLRGLRRADQSGGICPRLTRLSRRKLDKCPALESGASLVGALRWDIIEASSSAEYPMPSETKSFTPFPHDWHSSDYVAGWINHDFTRDPERRPVLRQMLAAAQLPPDAALEVLDVGAGYGVVTEEVLR